MHGHHGQPKKKNKIDKKKFAQYQAKKFPEMKMMVNGDYRGSNFTMSSDDEGFNVSSIII